MGYSITTSPRWEIGERMDEKWVVGLVGTLVAGFASFFVWVWSERSKTQVAELDKKDRESTEKLSKLALESAKELERERALRSDRDAIREEITTGVRALDKKLSALATCLQEMRDDTHGALAKAREERGVLAQRIGNMESKVAELAADVIKVDDKLDTKRIQLASLITALQAHGIHVAFNPNESTGVSSGPIDVTDMPSRRRK